MQKDCGRPIVEEVSAGRGRECKMMAMLKVAVEGHDEGDVEGCCRGS